MTWQALLGGQLTHTVETHRLECLSSGPIRGRVGT